MSRFIIGVDPGLVHTGVVGLEFNPGARVLDVHHRVIDGLDPVETRAQVEDIIKPRAFASIDTFIEYYRPRSGFATDERMVQANVTFKDSLHGKLVRNTGVKKIVGKDMLELLHVWKFPTATHHDDLRSAARIAILGMLLDPILNRVVYDYAIDHSEGRPWYVAVI